MARLKNTSLKIAIPKKGRLRDPAVTLLHKAGYFFNNDPKLLHSYHPESNIDFLFLRTSDIPTLIEEGAIDLGITGKNNVLENRANIHEVLSLEYGHCSLCLAGPQKGLRWGSSKDSNQDSQQASKQANKQGAKSHAKNIISLEVLAQKHIATSFPYLAKTFFRQHNIRSPHLIELSGSLEIMVALKLCDAIIDIVETGTTLKENQLQVYHTIGNYYTALYARKTSLQDPRVILMKKRLTSALLAQNYRIIEYNIKKSLLKKAETISPGFDSPTVSHLDDPERVAVKILVEKSSVITLMDQLENIGATAIFETEIKNCRL